MEYIIIFIEIYYPLIEQIVNIVTEVAELVNVLHGLVLLFALPRGEGLGGLGTLVCRRRGLGGSGGHRGGFAEGAHGGRGPQSVGEVSSETRLGHGRPLLR